MARPRILPSAPRAPSPPPWPWDDRGRSRVTAMDVLADLRRLDALLDRLHLQRARDLVRR